MGLCRVLGSGLVSKLLKRVGCIVDFIGEYDRGY